MCKTNTAPNKALKEVLKPCLTQSSVAYEYKLFTLH